MSVIGALYAFIDELINDSGSADALYEAVPARNARMSVDEARKVVRIYGGTQRFGKGLGEQLKNQHVRVTVQFIVKPDSDSLEDLDTAIEESLEMARQFFEAVTDNPTLNSAAVCDSNFYDDDGENNVEFGDFSIGAVLHGATYVDGLINHAS